ncbi:hypothetical protein [Marinoscillum sp.]|uniref:hypothetical protein n=1 Tax=Marinoscillum sp. TaxID=2024838 RepID=UPI003BACDE96
MIRIVLLSLWLGLGYCALAQVDKVYLRKGGIICGQVSTDPKEDTLSITVGADVIKVPISAIEEVHLHKKNDLSIPILPELSYPKGWSTNLSLGTTFGKRSASSATKMRLYMTVSETYRLYPLLNIGIGTGVYSHRDLMIFPVYLEYYATTGKSRNTFMIYGNVGHGFARPTRDLEDNMEVKGGLLYSLGIGWQKKVAKNHLQMRLGYIVQETKEEEQFGETNSYIRKRTLNRIALQIQYSFGH